MKSRAEYLAGSLRDVRYGVRILFRAKGLSATAILILAAGIGANTAVFTFLDRLLLRPLPVPRPSQLFLISNSSHRCFSYDGYVYMRDRNQALASLAAESSMAPRERRRGRKIEGPAEAEAVSGNLFEVLGKPPLVGRTLAPSDDVRSGASHVAVASHRFWSRRYNRAADVLGQTIFLNDVPFTIIGVMPAGFFGTHQGDDPDLYIPAGSLPEFFGAHALNSMGLIGRLRPGVSLLSARSNLQGVAGERIDCQDGSSGYAGTGGEKQRSLELLAAIAALLLLMGCANVACLLMALGAAT